LSRFNGKNSALFFLVLSFAFLVTLKPGQWNEPPAHPSVERIGSDSIPAMADTTTAAPEKNFAVRNLPYGYPTPGEASRFHLSVADTIRKNDSMYASLRRNNIAFTQIEKLAKAFRGIFDFRKIQPGDFYWCGVDSSGRIERFCYWSLKYLNGPTPVYFTAELRDSVLVAGKNSVPVEVRWSGLSGRINSSLYSSILALNEKPPLDSKFADIFAWDVDFNTDPRPGDKFRMIFEKVYVAGKFASYGRILAASYITRKDTFTAFYYRGPGNTAGYYDRNGKSVEKTFLKSPLHYRRISSRFSRRRFHPIYKVYRPHYGVDYAAPVGTPVRCTASGKVVKLAYDRANGRYLKIKHRSNIYTYYLHLSRFAPGLRLGSHVNQGQTIGYVGSTGVSTGPHLDYRILLNGRFVDPLRVNFPAAPPISRDILADYRLYCRQMDELLSSADDLPDLINYRQVD